MSFRIARLGHHADGIADGPVFAERTLPGELVTGSLDGDRLQDIRIVEPSEHRVKAPCRHYASCGGCSLQHASDAFVAAWKTEVVRSALSARGLTAEFRAIHTSPPQTRRRATLAGRRSKKGALVGFHGRRSHQVTAITDCTMLHPDILAFVPQLEQLVQIGGSRSATLRLQVTVARNGLDVSVSGGKELDRALREGLAEWCGRTQPARLTWSDETIAQIQPPTQIFGSAQVHPPPTSFLQATQDGQDRLVADAMEAIQGAKRVADLFAGCGTFSFPAATLSQVHAVEGDPTMLSALDAGWRRSEGLKQITTEARDLFRRPVSSDELTPFDAVIIDPPRAGAEAQCHEIAGSGVSRMAYVSCNPVTFARDVEVLQTGGFQLDWVRPIDQFRWSAHVELAACLTRRHMAP